MTFGWNRCGWLAAALLVLFAGCEARNEFVPPPPPKVTVARPVEREVRDYVEFTGTTRATATVELRARVNGYLRQIGFEDGAMVQKGDLLFVVEQKPYRNALQAAQAELQKAEASLQLEQATNQRVTELVQRRAASPQELDVQKAKLATAKAEVASAEAAVVQAQQNLDYTEIRAPLSGRIGRHLVDEGNLVTAEQTLLATIESIDPIHAYFYVSESELLRFREMMRNNKLPDPEKTPIELELQLANETDFPHRGYVDYRQLGVDPSTGTVERRGVFPNPDNTLIPGLFVRVRAALGASQPKLLVDSRALGADQRGDFVLVVNEKNEVEYRPVKLGIDVGGLRVIEDGVSADDWIVINGLQRARPGSTVAPEQSAMVPESPGAAPTEDQPKEPAKEEDEPATPSPAS